MIKYTPNTQKCCTFIGAAVIVICGYSAFLCAQPEQISCDFRVIRVIFRVIYFETQQHIRKIFVRYALILQKKKPCI